VKRLTVKVKNIGTTNIAKFTKNPRRKQLCCNIHVGIGIETFFKYRRSKFHHQTEKRCWVSTKDKIANMVYNVKKKG
jgi:hypothetical protein